MPQDQPFITVKEAAAMYHIGQKKLRAIIRAAPRSDWIWNNGRYNYIRRKEFENFLAGHYCVQEIV